MGGTQGPEGNALQESPAVVAYLSSSSCVFKMAHYIPARSLLRENDPLQSPKCLQEVCGCTLEGVLKESLEPQGLTLDTPSQTRGGPMAGEAVDAF